MARRTSIDIDDARVAEARAILGTRGLKDTVDRALDEVIRSARRRRLAERLETGSGLDLGQAVLEQVRAART